MKILILYDSFFGNTKKLAEEVKELLKEEHSASLKNVRDTEVSEISEYGLLIAGSPTRAFRPSENFKPFLKGINKTEFKGKKFMAFDTGIPREDVPGFVSFLIKLFGYASTSIHKKLLKKGGIPIAAPETFFVGGKEGPIKDGEIKRIKNWVLKGLEDLDETI